MTTTPQYPQFQPYPTPPPPYKPPKPSGQKAVLLTLLACGGLFVLFIAAVAAIGGTSRTAENGAVAASKPSTTVSGLAPTTPPTSPAPTTTTTAPTTTTTAGPTVVLDESGTSSKNTAEFTTGAKWDIAWSYDCSANTNPYMRTGNFIVNPMGTSHASGGVNELGANGEGVQHMYARGTFHLSVITSCPWHLVVTSL